MGCLGTALSTRNEINATRSVHAAAADDDVTRYFWDEVSGYIAGALLRLHPSRKCIRSIWPLLTAWQPGTFTI
eukprot:1160680-Pelagomonas_calceolata.AAC.6